MKNWGPESVTFKFFESGHSFMKADLIHEQIDFEDLEKLINSSNNHIS